MEGENVLILMGSCEDKELVAFLVTICGSHCTALWIPAQCKQGYIVGARSPSLPLFLHSVVGESQRGHRIVISSGTARGVLESDSRWAPGGLPSLDEPSSIKGGSGTKRGRDVDGGRLSSVIKSCLKCQWALL